MMIRSATFLFSWSLVAVLWHLTCSIGTDPFDYGVDVTFPIHGYIKKKSFFKTRYEEMMAGCYKSASRGECDGNERARMEMSRDQPATQHNYTELGFKKMRVPDGMWSRIQEFYQKYKNGYEKLENWPRGNTYVNNWESPTYMLSFEDSKLRGGATLKEDIWANIKPIIEEWTGKTLVESSLYGIRIYKRGAVLSTHVDRLPLVSSCIIQVDQDIDEPWPAEVYSHAGKAYNFTMVPGDMLLYESHTVLHGRPFPLNGTFYANIFVHYIPIDHDTENTLDREATKKGLHRSWLDTNKNIAGHEQDNTDIEAIRRHIMEIQHRDRDEVAADHEEEGEEEEEEQEEEEGPDAFEMRNGILHNKRNGQTALHVAAEIGDLTSAEKLLKTPNSDLLHARDSNEWQAIHEAARGGHMDLLKFLVDMGADIGAKTSNGGTPLWWARRLLENAEHPVIQYLESIGAPEEGEDL